MLNSRRKRKNQTQEMLRSKLSMSIVKEGWKKIVKNKMRSVHNDDQYSLLYANISSYYINLLRINISSSRKRIGMDTFNNPFTVLEFISFLI